MIGAELPTIYKHLDGNDYEIEVFHNCPGLRDHVHHINDMQQFDLNISGNSNRENDLEGDEVM